VKFTPVGGGNGGIALHVPYLVVPRPLAHVALKLDKNDLKPTEPSTTARVSNIDGLVTSAADFYAWGIEDGDDGFMVNDVRAVGVQSFANPLLPADPNRRLLVFAVNMWRPWSHASVNEVDILIDVNNDGKDDYALVGLDLGLLQAGAFSGTYASAVFNLITGAGTALFIATAPTNSSTMLLPIRTSNLCQTNPAPFPPSPCLNATSNPRFTYSINTFGLRLAEDDIGTQRARFNAWTSSISQGMFAPLAPNATANVPVSVNVAEWAQTPARGVMVTSNDNRDGQDEARLIEVKVD
jgi:minor extracellular serine protease Vpr